MIKRSNFSTSTGSGTSTTTRLSTCLFIVMILTMLQLLLSFYHAHSVLDSASGSANSEIHNVEGQLRKFRSTESEHIHSSSPQKNLIVTRIEEAGIAVTPDILARIPPFTDFTKMYGDKPIILGLDRCEVYQNSIDPPERMFGAAGYVHRILLTLSLGKQCFVQIVFFLFLPFLFVFSPTFLLLPLFSHPPICITRMFNTGTNLLYELMEANCHNRARMEKYDKNTHGLRWQVPWGKHSPLSYRVSHKAKQGMGLNELNFFAVMVLKDPYTWMQSLCRNSYTARWKHHKDHCPNLIPNDVDKDHHFVTDEDHEKDLKRNGIPISIDYNPNTSHYAHMADAWNTWNGAYIDADFPRLIIRFEDLLLHARAVITEICRCYGGTLVNETHIQYIATSAKKPEHGHSGATSGFVEALLLYSNATNRVKSFTREDLLFANKTLNQTIMTLLSYSQPLN